MILNFAPLCLCVRNNQPLTEPLRHQDYFVITRTKITLRVPVSLRQAQCMLCVRNNPPLTKPPRSLSSFRASWVLRLPLCISVPLRQAQCMLCVRNNPPLTEPPRSLSSFRVSWVLRLPLCASVSLRQAQCMLCVKIFLVNFLCFSCISWAAFPNRKRRKAKAPLAWGVLAVLLLSYQRLYTERIFL